MFWYGILQSGKFKGTDFKYDNSIFKFQSKKYPNHSFLFVPNLSIFIFVTNFVAIRQIRGTDLKYGNCFFFCLFLFFFQILTQKFSNKAIFTFAWNIAYWKNAVKDIEKKLVPDIKIFNFARNFAFRKIQRCWFQTWQKYFQIPVQKYPNQTFLVLKVRIFVFASKENSRVLISNMTMVFSNSSPEIPPKKAIFVLNLSIYIFGWNFPHLKIQGYWFKEWQWYF